MSPQAAVPAEDRAAVARGTSRRRVIVGLAIGLPVSAAFLYLAARNLDPQEVLDALGSADPALLALAVLLLVPVYVAQAARWRRIARREAAAPLRTFLELVVACVAVNNVVPGRPGEPLRAYWLSRRCRAPVGRCLGTVVVDRASDVVTLVVLLVVALRLAPHPAWLRNVAIAGILLAALLAAAIGLAWWYAERSARGRRRAGLHPSERSFVRRHASALVRATAAAVTWRDLLVVGAWSVAAWGAWTGMAWLVAYSIDLSLTPAEILLVTGVLNLGSAIPSSPGFVGTYQWLSVETMAMFGVTSASAFAFSILVQAVWLIPTTAAGIIIAARGSLPWRLRPADLEPGSANAP